MVRRWSVLPSKSMLGPGREEAWYNCPHERDVGGPWPPKRSNRGGKIAPG